MIPLGRHTGFEWVEERSRTLRTSLAIVATALVLAGVGCPGGGPDGDGRDNLTACQEYVEAVNDVFETCGEDLPFDEATECPESLNAYAADCTEWFDCLHDAYECDEEEMEILADWDHCVSCF